MTRCGRGRDSVASRVVLATKVAAGLVLLLTVAHSAADPAPQRQPPVPKVLPPAVRAACDAAYDTVSKIPGVSVKRRTGAFSDETLRRPVFGCGLSISGSFARAGKAGDAATRLHESFLARGWLEMLQYGADGKDGTSFAFRHAEVSCLARGKWDGGADGEPNIPPKDWYKVALFCASPVFPEERER